MSFLMNLRNDSSYLNPRGVFSWMKTTKILHKSDATLMPHHFCTPRTCTQVQTPWVRPIKLLDIWCLLVLDPKCEPSPSSTLQTHNEKTHAQGKITGWLHGQGLGFKEVYIDTVTRSYIRAAELACHPDFKRTRLCITNLTTHVHSGKVWKQGRFAAVLGMQTVRGNWEVRAQSTFHFILDYVLWSCEEFWVYWSPLSHFPGFLFLWSARGNE